MSDWKYKLKVSNSDENNFTYIFWNIFITNIVSCIDDTTACHIVEVTDLGITQSNNNLTY